MNIVIQKPELEALILYRMKQGAFHSVEDLLLQAMKSSSPAKICPEGGAESGAGTDLIAAMQASPYKEISLDAERRVLPTRDVVF